MAARSPERLGRARRVFHAVIDLAEREQDAHLEQLCEGDRELFSMVRGLLAADRGAPGASQRIVAGLGQAAAQLIADQERALIGTVLGDYRVVDVLGRGGMGVVYRAERLDAPGEVAIKVIRGGVDLARFKAEQHIHAPLKNPAIPQLHSYGTTPNGAPYLVFELVEGGEPITEHVRARHCTLRERLRLFVAACEAVQYAHDRAVVHRDLKPSNILVKPEGTVHLLDFGIAKQLSPEATGLSQTRADARAFTPEYAAPEQYRAEPTGVFTDVYSLGVVLYELIAGRHPIDHEPLDLQQLAAKVCGEDRERVSVAATRSGRAAELGQVRRGEWADLDGVVQKAMERAPGERYRSVRELIDDIGRFSRAEPLQARPATLRYRSAKFVRRHRLRLMLATLGLCVLGGLGAAYTLDRLAANEAMAAETARTARVLRFMTDLMEGGDDEVGPSQGLKVEQVLERALKQAGALGRDPALQAELFATVGTVYVSLGKLDEAATVLPKALAQDKRIFGWLSREVVRDLLALGQLALQQNELARAERDVRWALDVIRRAQPQRDDSFAKASSLLGDVLCSAGRYTEAIDILQAAERALRTSRADPAARSAVVGSLANAQFYLGHYAESERLNREGMKLDAERLGPRHPYVAQALLNLGAIALERGNYQASEAFDRQALEILRDWYGEQHTETGSALTIWARALSKLHRYQEAQTALDRALAINRALHGENHPSVASTYNELGIVARELGALDRAQDYAEHMLAIERSLYPNGHYHTGIALVNLGAIHLKQGRFADAEARIREGLAVYARTLAADHNRVAFARIKLGECLFAEHRYEEALTETQAGYDALQKQSSAPAEQLALARDTLLGIQRALGARNPTRLQATSPP